MMAITRPMPAAAAGNPTAPIAAAQSGEKTTPPILKPLYAIARAAWRPWANHGDTIALIAATPIATQPAPLSRVAAKSRQGAVAIAQPNTPAARRTAPALVTTGMPKRRVSAGRLATTAAPTRKRVVTAVEIKASGQPVLSWTACK